MDGSFFSLFLFFFFFLCFIHLLWIYIISTCSLSLSKFQLCSCFRIFHIIIVFLRDNWIMLSNILFFHIFLGISRFLSINYCFNYLLLLPTLFAPLLPTKPIWIFFRFFIRQIWCLTILSISSFQSFEKYICISKRYLSP